MTAGEIYKIILFNLTLIMVLGMIVKVRLRDELPSDTRRTANFSLWFWALALTLFFGLRPVYGGFVDTSNYANMYANIARFGMSDVGGMEWLFNGLMYLCATAGLHVSWFFTLIAAIYVYSTAYACRNLFKDKAFIAFLAVICAFSFYSYATNGIRNGAAASLLMLAISLWNSRKAWSVVLMVCAAGTHVSILIPIAAFAAGTLINHKKSLYIWIACLALAIIFGNTINDLLVSYSGLIDTGKSEEYLSNDNETYLNLAYLYNTGFRWDFIIYGFVPIALGLFYISKYGTDDKTYRIIFNTYVLTNAFWLLMMRSWLSNRYAYLSWFLYGIVIIYPLLKFPHIRGRNFKLRLTLFGNVAFTYFMWIIGKIV
jgi:hypothetical protein